MRRALLSFKASDSWSSFFLVREDFCAHMINDPFFAFLKDPYYKHGMIWHALQCIISEKHNDR